MLAALVWHVGAVMLLLKAGDLLFNATRLRPGPAWPASAVAAAILSGSLMGRTNFRKLCLRNVKRIGGLPDPKIWHMYRSRFYPLLGLMILTGAVLSRLAEGRYLMSITVGWLDLSLALALLVGGTGFWQNQNLV